MLPLPHIDDLFDCVVMCEMNNNKMNMTITMTFFLFSSPSGQMLQFKRDSLFIYRSLSRTKSKLECVTQDERIVHPCHFSLISSEYFYLCSWFWYRLATATKSLTAWNVVIRTNYNFIDLPGLTATSYPVKNLYFVLDLSLIGGACYSTHMHELFNYPSF